jgi:hypothetical protein
VNGLAFGLVPAGLAIGGLLEDEVACYLEVAAVAD